MLRNPGNKLNVLDPVSDRPTMPVSHMHTVYLACGAREALPGSPLCVILAPGGRVAF